MTIGSICGRAALGCAVLLLAAAANAAETDFPARKPGLWELKMVPETAKAAPQITMQLCVDAASDHAIMTAGLAMGGSCTVNRSQSGAALQFDATCDRDGRHTVSHTTITGDFQSAYQLKVVSDSEGGNPALPKHSAITQEAKWLGACPAGMNPGDMVMPGGHKMNVLNALKAGG
jgi:hypothetical protein